MDYKVPCGRTTGHGESCSEGWLCSGCTEIRRLTKERNIAREGWLTQMSKDAREIVRLEVCEAEALRLLSVKLVPVLFEEEYTQFQRDKATWISGATPAQTEDTRWYSEQSVAGIVKARDDEVRRLRNALEMARDEILMFGHAVRCGYMKPGSGAGNPLGACSCGHFKTVMAIDAALKGEEPILRECTCGWDGVREQRIDIPVCAHHHPKEEK